MMKRKRKNGEEELSRVIRIQGREEVRAQALLRSSWYHLLRIVYIPFGLTSNLMCFLITKLLCPHVARWTVM